MLETMEKIPLMATKLLLSILFISSSCQKEHIPANCIDPERVCVNCACTYELNPVCGCNEITYDNPCFAINNGVTEYTQGACSQ